MRILSWNINGIRTLPQYHPWNAFKSFQGILEELKADIICFQEMKSSRSVLDCDVAVPASFDSFFSFPSSRGGYSGVAVYTDSQGATPLKAEEGLSGKLQPKPPFTVDERISSSYPYAHEISLMADEEGNMPSDLGALDMEGRALVLDFGLFVLINVYCPNETSDARLPFKINFHYMLQERVRKLIEEDRREVIVLGDINICSTPLDHCDGHLASNAACFYDHPARAWFRSWLDPTSGTMIDVVRTIWPDRKEMYTCWNTKISARETNYGTRVDYILVTRGLLPWVKHGDILPSLKGSDHCPIYIDLHDDIMLESGEKVVLREAMNMNMGTREPPRIAAKFWEEFSGKQTKLSTFFTKRGIIPPSPEGLIPSSVEEMTTPTQPSSQASASEASQASSMTPPLTKSQTPPSPKEGPQTASTSKSLKRKLTVDSRSTSSKLQKRKPGQAKLSSFFPKPLAKSNDAAIVDLTLDDAMEDTDRQLALQLSQSQEGALSQALPTFTSSAKNASGSQTKAVWSQLMAPIQPPKCTVHGEAAKEFTVMKPGPNKGKVFFVCSRPVGPGYDRGKAERLREEVNPEYKCNFFKWASDVKRESLKVKPSAKPEN